MDRRALDSLSTAIALSAAIAVTASFAFGGLRVGMGATVGALVSLANWAFLRWLVRRFTRVGNVARAGLMTLLAAKLGVLGFVVWIAVGLLRLHQGGFGLGLGALVVGLVVGTLRRGDDLTWTGETVGALAHDSLDAARKDH
jgi:hypothetical protein